MSKRAKAADVLADNLLGLMSAKGIKSEPQLEKISKVSQKTINNIAHRRHDPRLSTMEQLSTALGVELFHLLCPAEDQNFLALCLAWAQSDERGRDDLHAIAEAILKKRGTVTERGASPPTIHRARDRAG